MTLQEQIYNDYQMVLKQPAMDSYSITKNNYKFIVGELQRQPSKELTDAQVISIFKKFIKSITDSPAVTTTEDTALINLMQKYMPAEATDEEVSSFISTIDFSKYSNRMQAMKEIMQHFGSTVDGNKVKESLKIYTK